MKRAHTIRGSALTLALIMAMFFTACSAPQGGDRSDTPPLGGSAVSSDRQTTPSPQVWPIF